MKGSYIKLDRSLLEWEWYRDTKTKVLWLHLLLKANWKKSRFMGHEIPRGTLATSLPHLAEETGLTIKEVRTALNHLQETGEITKKRAGNMSLITIEKYAKFQDVPENKGRPRADQGQTEGRQGATIEEYKEEKEYEALKNDSPPKGSSIADRLTEEEWEKLEKKISNEDIIALIDEADFKGVPITHPYAYLMTMARNGGLI